jgi:hypothetical protein
VESAAFRFAHDLTLRVSGTHAAVRHARREYGAAEAEGIGAADVEIQFGTVGRAEADGAEAARERGDRIGRGGHKTVAWRVRLGDPAATPLEATIETRGWPGSFARSLVQGYVVEPVLSIAAARRGMVLVPGAGIELDGGLALLLGRSRAGKSTLAARALAAGRTVLGDDQLFVDTESVAWPFPRSLRFYPDLERTAPTAWERLPPRVRLALRIRGVVARVSRGFIRPSLAVPRTALGALQPPECRTIGRIILIERDTERQTLATEPGSTDDAVDWAAGLLREQRERLVLLGGSRWDEAVGQTAVTERVTLGAAFAGVGVERLAIPRAWDAARAVDATARLLSI